MVFGQPLPLGMAGKKEFMDVRSEADIPFGEIKEKLNLFLPSGIRIVSAGEPVYKPKEIMMAEFTTEMDISYADAFKKMWQKESITVEKKSKKGLKEIDLKKEIVSLEITEGEKLTVNTVMPCTVDGAVTPVSLMDALKKYTGGEIFARHSRDGFFLDGMTEFK